MSQTGEYLGITPSLPRFPSLIAALPCIEQGVK